jgi:hypothetical protein
MNTISLRRLVAIREEKKVIPPALAIDTNSRFVYSNGADVMKTFRRYGFVPPSEVREDYLFKKNREMKDE